MSNRDFYEYLLRDEAYNASTLNCYAFCRSTDVRNGIALPLGNMVSGFPFEVNGVPFVNSECAYIAGAFSLGTPLHNDLQRRLQVCSNGFIAKKTIGRKYQAEKRVDWDSLNVYWMMYVVWSKCMGNEDFRNALLALPHDAIIIEDSSMQHGETATFWGTRNAILKEHLNSLKRKLKANGMSKAVIKREQDRMRLGQWANVGIFRGRNVMGKILMACRKALESGEEPLIDYGLLRSAHIYLLGKEITFNQQHTQVA